MVGWAPIAITGYLFAAEIRAAGHFTPRGHGRGRRCADEDYREEEAWLKKINVSKTQHSSCVDEA